MKLLKDSITGELGIEEESLMKTCCLVLNATAFEVESSEGLSLRGLYPLSGMMNHSCSPNTSFFFTDGGRFMTVTAAKPLLEGDQVFTSYCPLLWPTWARRFHLSATKHFDCDCPRCEDPTVCTKNSLLIIFYNRFYGLIVSLKHFSIKEW